MKRRLLALATTAPCSSAAACGIGSARRVTERRRGVAVTAAFYPLQFVTQQVGGDPSPVTALTKPGAEPHDLELTPKDVGGLTRARLVVYPEGFQPAVDEAMAQPGAGAAVDVATRRPPRRRRPRTATTASEDEHAEHAEAPRPALLARPDPLRRGRQAIAERLAQRRPGQRRRLPANAEAFVAELTALDGEFRRASRRAAPGTSSPATPPSATSPTATASTRTASPASPPRPSPTPPPCAISATTCARRGVTTIYPETLVEPEVRRDRRPRAGAKCRLLDPIEGITDASRGQGLP